MEQILQALREPFWSATSISSLPGFVVSLAVAALLGVVIGQAYVRFGQSLSNRRLFARNFLLLTVTTTLIITIVRSSLALSLGLVGALSIVRFRAAIKEPEELAFLFLAIGVGLGLGAGQGLLTIVALAVILSLVVVRGLVRRPSAPASLYVTVAGPASERLTVSQIMEAFAATGASASLTRLDETPEAIEASFQAAFGGSAQLEAFCGRVRALSQGARISCLEDSSAAG